ncbi:MAG: DUF4426 domain-containing protein [Pseudomonadota bacterium]|nr:DUF4426 domain-containing protein [Pseudomonadota bacterium]
MKIIVATLLSCWFPLAKGAEIVREHGFEVQIQPFPSTFLTREVAGLHGFERSRRQALINVVVLNVQPDGQARGAVPAEVTGFSKNLLGQTQTLRFKEIDEGEGAIYYLAPLRVSSEEEIQIALEVLPENAQAIDIKFEHRVYVD